MLLLAAFLSGTIFISPRAQAATSPVPLGGVSASLTQQSAGTWTTTVYLDTGALCQGLVSFDLLTTKPFSDTADTSPQYVGGLRCGAQATHPVTEVLLTFTRAPALSAVPQTATLAVTPPPAVLAQDVAPLDITLTVRREVPVTQYLWIPVGCGLALAVLLIGLTMLIGVPRPGGGTVHVHRVRFWRMPLYAASAWTFKDSWATNVTAVGAIVGTVLTASGGIAELLPGVELGRFSLLIAVAGGITIIAPLAFAALNYRLGQVDPATAGVAAISLPPEANEHGVTIAVPASGTVTVHGYVDLPGGGRLNPDTSLDIPAGAVITVSSPKPAAAGGVRQVLALPGSSDIAVTPGQQIVISESVTIPSGAMPASKTARFSWPKPLVVAAAAATDAPTGTLPAKTVLVVPEGAKISFLGRASVTLPKGTWIEAPVAERADALRRSVLKYQREYAIPHSSQVVAATMWTMLVASCLTVFGIGAEIGIVGWVLGYDLVVAPQWVRVSCLVVAAAAAVLLLGYGVTAIRALADSREGTALSNAQGSSFML
jgi:hypothetical protein